MPKSAPPNISTNADTTYRGRFAPSPTGPLHFGSLVAAIGGFLQARQQRGKWLVRVEDIDPPREVAGAADEILHTLDAFGLHWDGPVVYQSQRADAYRDAIERLTRSGAIYPCACSRSEIADSSVTGIDGLVYPGTCRAGLPAGRPARALRVRTDDTMIEFSDRWQGVVGRRPETAFGDFVVRRADGQIAYQLAVVMDDAAEGITEVVRGADLLESTPRQIHLQRLLQLPTPVYAHLPVIVHVGGAKLSKQTAAARVEADHALPVLWQALRHLGQDPPAELRQANLAEFWRYAIATWRPDSVPRRLTIAIEP